MREFDVEVKDLTFSYNGKPVLDGVTFRVPRGEFLALLGPNGGGKTTLVRWDHHPHTSPTKGHTHTNSPNITNLPTDT